MGTPGGNGDDSGVSAYSKAMRSAGPLLGAGIQLAASVVLMFLAGRWLDGRLGSAPWFMLAGIFIGLGAGFYQFMRTVGSVERKEAEDRKKHED